MYLQNHLEEVGKIIEKTKIFTLKEFNVKVKVITKTYIDKGDFERGRKLHYCDKTLCVNVKILEEGVKNNDLIGAYDYYGHFGEFYGLLFYYTTQKQCIAESVMYKLLSYLNMGKKVGTDEAKREFYHRVLKSMYGDNVNTNNKRIRL